MTAAASSQSAIGRDLQRVAVKMLTDAPLDLNLNPFLSIFGRWRTEKEHPGVWVDLADYAHMPRGPGIVLIGKNCNFSFDMGGAAPGPLYVSKQGLEGTPEDRLASVLRSCFELTRRLLAEAEFPASVHLRTGSLELTFNDRLETPNDAATDHTLRPVVLTTLDRLLGAGGYHLALEPDSNRRYGFSIQARGSDPLETLLSRLTP